MLPFAAQISIILASGKPSDVEFLQIRLGVFEKLELNVGSNPFNVAPSNPFNFSECRVFAVFESGCSSGKPCNSRERLTVDGFYMQKMRRNFVNASIRYAQHELLVPDGPPGWFVRWSAAYPGSYSYQVFSGCEDQPRPTILTSGTIVAVATKKAGGYVQVSPNGRHFKLSYSGRSFVPIGQNLAYPTIVNGSFDTDRWLQNLAAHGGNFARVWLGSSLLYEKYNSEILNNQRSKGTRPPQSLVALEHLPYRYDQKAAWRFDQTLQTARENGIQILATLESFSSLRTPPALYADWNFSVYNQRNNGSVSSPHNRSAAAAFFRSVAGARQYAQRVRYAVARYGWSSSLFGWELWNELTNAFTPVDTNCTIRSAGGQWCQYNMSKTDVQHWHKKQLLQLKELDLGRHLVSTSFTDITGDSVVEAAMDFSTTHVYDRSDMAIATHSYAHTKANRYNKPSFIGECGVHPLESDPTGISLENSLWAPLFGQAAGASACWFWNYWVPHYHLYPLFQSVATFVAAVPWADLFWTNQNHTRSRIPEYAWITGMNGRNVTANASISENQFPTWSVVFLHNKNYTWMAENKSHSLSTIGWAGPHLFTHFNANSHAFEH